MPKNRCFWIVVLEKTLESPLDSKEIRPVNPKWNQPWIFIGRTWCWSWSSNTLATWCKEPTHWKRPWFWERSKAGGEGDDRMDSWMALLTQRTWIWANSGRWWRTGKPGVLQSTGSQRVGRNWATELNSKLLRHKYIFSCVSLTIQFNILLNISVRLTPGQIHKICMRLKYQVIREMKDAWNQDKRTQKSSRRCSHWSKMPKRTNKINNCHKLKYQVYLNPRVHKNI